jgi:hypothetical protein
MFHASDSHDALLFCVDEHDPCAQLHGWAGDAGQEPEQGEGDTQDIMLSMWDAKPLNKRDSMRARNRACARRSREADRTYMELLLAELNSLAETFAMYATYIAQLQQLGACAADCTHGLGLCLAHTTNIARVQKGDAVAATPTLVGTPAKERNRIHAQKSRWRKSCFMRDMLEERDASLSTVADLLQSTRTLEGSCSLLNDFSEHVPVFLTLTEVRQRLLQRASTHAQECENLKSPLIYREMHRVHFR